MTDKICQSCGLVMSEKDDSIGTNFDGTLSSEYCSYCYNLGEFVVDCSLDEMVESCVPLILEEYPEVGEESANEQMREYLLKLKRWQKN